MLKKTSEVRVRYAPSPTGYFHIGAARTTLFNLLFARQNGGKFILRIEDTDKERSKKEYEEEIIATMHWLGLDYDEFYRQTDRLDIYETNLKKLLEEKKAYYCYCSQEELEAERQSMSSQGLSPIYNGKCRSVEGKKEAPSVIRIKVPVEKLTFKDMIRGEVTFDTRLMGDIVIAKSLREPLYNFAVVVDDYDMKISHVIRGEEHIANTPKQMVIADALGIHLPIFAHLPLILNTDRSKMSKRDGERVVAVRDYKKAGYLPQALLNFLVLLGWHPEGNEEVLNFAQMAEKFDITRIQKAGAVFNFEKLDWFNAHYIKQLSVSQLVSYLTDGGFIEPDWAEDSDKIKKVIELLKERMKKLSEFKDLAKVFFILPQYQKELLVWKKSDANSALAILIEIKKLIEADTDINSFVEASAKVGGGRGDVLWPLRVALSGSQASPGPFELMQVLGKKESLARIAVAITKLS